MTKNEPSMLENLIDFEALDHLFDRIRKEVFTNMIVPLVVIAVMWSEVSDPLLIAWGVLMFIGIGVNYLVAISYIKQRSAIIDPRKWSRRMSSVMLYFGLLWVYAIFLFYIEGSVGHQIFLISIAIIFSLGSVMVGLYWLPMFYLLAVPVLLALVVRLAMEGTLEYISLAILMLWTLTMSAAIAKMLNKTVRSEMRLRHESVALNDQLKTRTKEAQAATIAKSKFLAAASHDLRQPLHALSLFVDALKESKSEEERITIFPRLELSLDALRKLFDALLDVSKLDAKVVSPEYSHFDLAEMLYDISKEFEGAANKKNLNLRVNTTSSIIYSDRLLLGRVLRNLLSNAIRYTNTGHVLLTTRRSGDNILLQVWDTGVGIPPESQEEIFMEFQQLPNVHRHRTQGLGLGLALVRRLCDLLKHSLSLRSQPGKGSVFSINITGGDTSLLSSSDITMATQSWDLRGRCILVIDDDQEILHAMQSLLSKWGCDIIIADSLADAVDRIESENAVPELILSDLRLRNEKTGIDAIEAVRDQYGQSIPGILITGDTEPEQLQLAEQSGYALLQKPVRPAHLRTIIHRHLPAMAES